ncbi:folate-binding protein [Trichocoleus sp. DQ-A3]|uniref:CAF17-like 4Fe-4S cluster assembly/insertion protein YgfZ n=1 Tax=Cyanophyceae TaxID=3028117 RepID=UPI001684B62D|nr:folate-binding protein YgfZ [Coleofasciculus sp. FACHB-125]MBD1903180.1 folate-binding protein YgfZ [Coleofasciculus sp. FACHB-125]
MPTSAIDGNFDDKSAAAIQAAREGVAVCDRSHWGRIQVSEGDRIRFLHNQSTNDFQRLKPGQGCDTVFVTSTARTIDLTTAYVMEDAVLLLVSANRREKLLKWLDQYIFFADKVQLTDVTDNTATFSLIGPGSDALLEQLGAGAMIGQPDGSHQQLTVGDIEVRVAVGSGLATPGYTLILSAADKETLWNTLAQAGAVPMSDRVWEHLRIEQGRPAPDLELTEDYNPLEAGLWQTISFEKGCYIGQETIARLNTYKGVKQHLWGVRLNTPAQPGSVISVGEEKVGKLTSYTETDQGSFGLGYVRTKAGGEGLKVQVGESEGELVAVPFVTHDYV